MNKRQYDAACKKLKSFEENRSADMKEISTLALLICSVSESLGRTATVTEKMRQWIDDSNCLTIKPGTLKKYRLTAARYIKDGDVVPTWGEADFTVHVHLDRHPDRWELVKNKMTTAEAREHAGRAPIQTSHGSGDSFTNTRSALGFIKSAGEFTAAGIHPHEHQMPTHIEHLVALIARAEDELNFYDPEHEMRPATLHAMA